MGSVSHSFAMAQTMWLFILGACTSGGSGLNETDEPKADVLGILITPEQVVIPEGDSVQLTATGLKDDRTS